MTECLKFEEINASVQRIRSLRKGFITNFYQSSAMVGLWTKYGSVNVYNFESSVFIIRQNNEFYNVYYACTSVVALQADLQKLSSVYDGKELVIDWLGREKEIACFDDLFSSCGFDCYCSLIRMSRPIVQSEQSQPEVEYATLEDLSEIFLLLNNFFDQKSEQLPCIESLESWINARRVLKRVIDNKIAGFLIFEINGVTSYLRYWFALPDYRDKKVGSTLLRQFFAESSNAKRQYFWVVQNNDNALKRYRHYGFQEEDMYDRVYVSSNKINNNNNERKNN